MVKAKSPNASAEKIEIETVHLEKGSLPDDYVGASGYARKYAGELIRPDGKHYSRNERRAYYVKKDGHPATTPLHIARWAIQKFTKPGDWVLDPTVGSGTTIVEALRLGRNAAGVEIEFFDILKENIRANNPLGMKYHVVHGDAREVGKLIKPVDAKFSLVVNNPPYSGDLRQHGLAEKRDGKWDNKSKFYDPRFRNLAFMKESPEYWKEIESIYVQCIAVLKPGGTFVIGVKDMMRSRKPYKLHELFGDILSKHLEYRAMVVLLHSPPTLHLNTYEKKFGVPCPKYQTILVFQKKEGKK